MSIPFVTLDDPRYGEVVQVSPLIRRVIAHNPSKFTYHGTGTYLVGGRRGVVVIDPGPLDDTHRAALAAAIGDAPVLGVLVTHCHADHVPLAAPLAAETGANTFGFGPHPLSDPDYHAELPENAGDGALTSAIIAMAHGLQLDVVAEGVETEAQARFLELRGCDELQGYLFGRPCAPEQFVDWLRVQPTVARDDASAKPDDGA